MQENPKIAQAINGDFTPYVGWRNCNPQIKIPFKIFQGLSKPNFEKAKELLSLFTAVTKATGGSRGVLGCNQTRMDSLFEKSMVTLNDGFGLNEQMMVQLMLMIRRTTFEIVGHKVVVGTHRFLESLLADETGIETEERNNAALLNGESIKDQECIILPRKNPNGSWSLFVLTMNRSEIECLDSVPDESRDLEDSKNCLIVLHKWLGKNGVDNTCWKLLVGKRTTSKPIIESGLICVCWSLMIAHGRTLTTVDTGFTERARARLALWILKSHKAVGLPACSCGSVMGLAAMQGEENSLNMEEIDHNLERAILSLTHDSEFNVVDMMTSPTPAANSPEEMKENGGQKNLNMVMVTARTYGKSLANFNRGEDTSTTSDSSGQTSSKSATTKMDLGTEEVDEILGRDDCSLSKEGFVENGEEAEARYSNIDITVVTNDHQKKKGKKKGRKKTTDSEEEIQGSVYTSHGKSSYTYTVPSESTQCESVARMPKKQSNPFIDSDEDTLEPKCRSSGKSKESKKRKAVVSEDTEDEGGESEECDSKDPHGVHSKKAKTCVLDDDTESFKKKYLLKDGIFNRLTREKLLNDLCEEKRLGRGIARKKNLGKEEGLEEEIERFHVLNKRRNEMLKEAKKGDQGEIYKVMYVPESEEEGYKLLGKERRTVGGVVEENDVDDLEEDWIIENFKQKFMQRLIECPKQWLHVPVGKSILEKAPKTVETKIIMKFQQGKKQVCLFYSAASALWHMGHKKAAKNMKQLGLMFENMDATTQFDALREVLTEHCPSLCIPVVYNGHTSNSSKSKKTISHEELIACPSNALTIVVPMGEDLSTAHCVAVVNDLIFDSTQRKALTLCKESFDWIVNHKNGIQHLGLVMRFENRNGKIWGLMRKHRRRNGSWRLMQKHTHRQQQRKRNRNSGKGKCKNGN